MIRLDLTIIEVMQVNNEMIRKSVNVFLKLYFDSCKEVYEEISFEKITRSQLKYLKAIYRNDNVTLTMLSERFHASKPTVNELITKLYDAKLVEKVKSTIDKRVTYLTLTSMGTLLATTNTLESQKLVENLKLKLNEEEIETMITIFEKLGVDEL